MRLRVHRFLPSTRVEGPGNRACVWVQGCPIRCDGCAVPWTWPEGGGTEVAVEELASAILGGPEVEGITLLGGEPFAQAAACARLARLLRREGKSVMTLTGYTMEQLEGRIPDGDSLLEATDLLIDGPYVGELADLSRPWVGSANQCYHFLTGRYAHLEQDLESIPNEIEVRIAADGTVQVNGMYDPDELAGMLREMGLEARGSSPGDGPILESSPRGCLRESRSRTRGRR